jgi:hypothetical protein
VARIGGRNVYHTSRGCAGPLTDTPLWKFTGGHVTTYGGKHGTIRGPWATSQYSDTITETAAGATVMSASALSSNGQNFAAWLRHR